MSPYDANEPNFLRDYGALYSHFQEQFDGLSSNEKGRKFAELVRRLTPHINLSRTFPLPVARQETHDGGVDFDATSVDGTWELHIQSKYTVAGVDELDSVFSKLKNFESECKSPVKQMPLDLADAVDKQMDGTEHHYMLVTVSDLSTSLPKYENQSRGSKEFYETLKRSGRCHIIDGRRLLEILRITYQRSQVRPSNLKLQFNSTPTEYADVFIGVLPTSELRRLYEEHGEALFLENIREWLGSGSGRDMRGGLRETPNEAMIETLKNTPAEFLARNNGVTFRAETVERENNHTLILQDASIVNGCQTTMAVVHGPKTDAQVVAKIARTTDAWGIAKAANFQNPIDRIWLELAQQIRPQMVRGHAARSGFQLSSKSESAFAVLDAIYKQRVVYEEMRALFVGLFSRNPNNLFKNNYSELRADAVHALPNDPHHNELYEALFAIQAASTEAADRTKDAGWSNDISDAFRRFWKEEKPNLRAFLTIIALCHFMDIDITLPDHPQSYDAIKSFVIDAQSRISREADQFVDSYLLAFKAIATMVITATEDRGKLLQMMTSEVERAKITKLLSIMHMIEPH